ncbi:hypothetical protein Y032_0017g3243 [Ancylostoma ceylanicum]|uniref:Reverse transcriptase domain-containing protein n=1 Tax=Ancylostoma ceylanicum TaxID=53326 RepID=A0A016V3K0_9BILA|nr:hypothetical protein Y032_0017g3243 [Ancylostoma ceylanicum]
MISADSPFSIGGPISLRFPQEWGQGTFLHPWTQILGVLHTTAPPAQPSPIGDLVFRCFPQYWALAHPSQLRSDILAFSILVRPCTPSGPSDGKHDLQKAIDYVSNWSKTWELPLAVDKSCVLPKGRGFFNPSYQLAGQSLKGVTEVRDLGFLMNDKLKFTSHCRMIASKAHLQTYRIFKALKTKNPQILTKASKTYVRPTVECGTTVFSPYTKKTLIYWKAFRIVLLVSVCSDAALLATVLFQMAAKGVNSLDYPVPTAEG